MNSDEPNLLSSPQSSDYSTAQPNNSFPNPYASYESSEISPDPNKYVTDSNLNDNGTDDKSFNAICLECLQCCSGTMEFFFCCCIFFECLSQCRC